MIKFPFNCLFPGSIGRNPFQYSHMSRWIMMMSLTTTTLLLPQLLVAQQTLEEVIVTAERREQSLQDTPISATVLTNDIIETKGIDDIYGVQNAAPSLSITEVGRSTFINIRGVGIARSAPTTTPGVAYYNDGVFIAKEVFIGNTFYDLKSIEVLRGPQGTLTGQNSTGGAVYVRTPEPEYEKMFGYIDQTFGDYDRFRTIAAVNVPISDNAAIRVAGTYNTSGSFSKCLNCPTTPGDDELYAIRANLQYEPSDSMKFNLRAEYFNSNTGNLPIKSRNDPIDLVILELVLSGSNFNCLYFSLRTSLKLSYQLRISAR